MKRSWITGFSWEVEKDVKVLLADAGQKNKAQKNGGRKVNVTRLCL